MSDQLIAEYAKRWIQLRDDTRGLAAERGSLNCSRAESFSHFGEILAHEGNKPCWKDYQYDEMGNGGLREREDWCANCLKRQEIHDRLAQLARHRGAALRLLIREVRKGSG